METNWPTRGRTHRFSANGFNEIDGRPRGLDPLTFSASIPGTRWGRRAWKRCTDQLLPCVKKARHSQVDFWRNFIRLLALLRYLKSVRSYYSGVARQHGHQG